MRSFLRKTIKPCPLCGKNLHSQLIKGGYYCMTCKVAITNANESDNTEEPDRKHANCRNCILLANI